MSEQATASIAGPAGRTEEVWSQVLRWVTNAWRAAARWLWEFLMVKVDRDAWEIRITDREIANFFGRSQRWVQYGLAFLKAIGAVSTYYRYGPRGIAGRMIVIHRIPAQPRTATSSAGPETSGSQTKRAFDYGTPARAPTPEELEAARPPTPEEIKAAAAREAERERKVKGIWDSLTDHQRRAIEASIDRENPGLRQRWPNMFVSLCIGRCEVEYGLSADSSSEDPRAP